MPRKSLKSKRRAPGGHVLPTPTEHDEAVVLVAWMRLRRLFFFHVTNEARRSYGLAKYLQAEGMVPGVPDYIVLSRPENIGNLAETDIDPPVFLELKRIGGTLSDSQIAFLERLQAEGCVTIVAYGADEAIAELMRLGY